MANDAAGTNAEFAAKFDFSRYKTFADFGGSTGNLCIHVAKVRCARTR